MRPFAAIIFLFALTAFVLPGVTAQNKDDEKKADKKDAKDEKKAVDKKDAKDEKKADDKKGDEKKDDKKDDTSKKTSGKAKALDPEEEKILHGTFILRARIQMMDGNSSGEFKVKLGAPYPAKVQAIQQWYKQQLQSKNISYETINQYKLKMGEADQIEVRTGQNMKVRTMFPPLEFDIKGNVKRWTPKEIAAVRGSSKLPGFPAQFDALKTGQIVDLYVPKIPVKKTVVAAKDNKDGKAKKKDLDDDPMDDPLLKPEVLMILVRVEAQPR